MIEGSLTPTTNEKFGAGSRCLNYKSNTPTYDTRCHAVAVGLDHLVLWNNFDDHSWHKHDHL